MSYYLVERHRLKLRDKSAQTSSNKDWDRVLETFGHSKTFANRAKYFAALLKANGVELINKDTLKYKGVTCSAIVLLRNLSNSKTKLVNSSKVFLKHLQSYPHMPEAIFT